MRAEPKEGLEAVKAVKAAGGRCRQVHRIAGVQFAHISAQAGRQAGRQCRQAGCAAAAASEQLLQG